MALAAKPSSVPQWLRGTVWVTDPPIVFKRMAESAAAQIFTARSAGDGIQFAA
jgi:hypothetical protein